jgi:RTX calcium-binding nonapeptide repeat (4 copies)/LVIVD repeat
VGTRRKEALRGTLAVLALVLVSAPAGIAAPGNRSSQLTADGAGLLSSAAEPPPDPTNLPGKQENLEVVGQLQIPGVRLGQIADLAVHKGFAYLNSWDDARCRDGGTYVVDIRNPSSPRLVTHIPANQPYYHGEGAHVISMNTPAFQGDILAVNNETYGSNLALESPPCNPRRTAAGAVDNTGGGFDLYDVSNPANPVPLVRDAGDRDPDNNPATAERAFANSYHSVFVWQDGPRAFLVASDNIEATDVDIFDITNPRAPVQVGDHDLVERFPQIMNGEQGNGASVFHHDVVVKHIGGRPVMKVDYWDAGYVQLDVTDPANPVHINDTTFAGEDPLLPGSGLTREGNAHQGEFSFDNQFLLAADEDFAPFRSIARSQSGDTAGRAKSAVEGGDNPRRIANLPDGRMNGPSTFVGNACDPATVPLAPADDGNPNTDDIALIERGGPPTPAGVACGFADKHDHAADRGWDGVVIFNQPRPDDGQVNMLTVDADGPPAIPGVHMRRVDALGPEGVLSNSTTTPPPGTPGPTLSVGADFDGWGYAHLYDAQTAQEIDVFAIDEARDSRFADGFGDLSIHEFATDPTEHLAYSSYYAGGIRVFQFSRQNGLNETGAWIADGGSNFWGVEQFTTAGGERLIAGSDRDFGLVILRYTGPGRALPPNCSDVTVMVPYKQSARVPFACSDANNNPLRQSRTSTPEGGTVADHPPAGGWTYTHTGNRLGPAGSFGFRANDGAADSNTATAGLVAVARNGGRCFNPFVGSSRNDIIIGSRFGDRIGGGRGRDTVRALGGADCVSGGPAGDRLSGHGGRDRLAGNRGADRLFGGGGRDRLIGAHGNDGLQGRGGADRLSGGRGPDRVNGGGGNDRISVGGATNRASGGAGNDRISARNGKRDKINCGGGRDVVRADGKDRVLANCETVRTGGQS